MVDDSSEINANGFRWKCVDCCTDGMIYQIDYVDTFDIDLTFIKAEGFSKFKFLSFSEQGTYEEIDISRSFSVQSVPN